MITSVFDAAQHMQAAAQVKAVSELGISKSSAARWLASRTFHHLKISVNKLPLLSGEILASEDAPQHMIVVDVNKNKINCSATYIPKLTVVCGTSIVKRARNEGLTMIDAWVGDRAARAMKIKLSAGAPGFNPSPNGPALGSFNLPRGRTNSATFPDFVNYGAPGSELNNPQFMSMLNVEEALSMYLSNLKDGIWKPVSSQWASVPPSLFDATKEAGLIAKEKGITAFAPLDFVCWQKTQLAAGVKAKYVDGKRLSASKFAYVGDEDDTSTWLFPADSMQSIIASAKALKANTYLPQKIKVLALAELKRRAGH